MAGLRTRSTPETEVFSDRALNAVQSGTRQLASVANGTPYRTSVVSGPLVFLGGDQRTFYHGLGRKPARWCVEDATVNAPAIFRVSWDEQKIVLEALPTFNTTVVIRVGVD